MTDILTPEERERILEEEKVRLSAQGAAASKNVKSTLTVLQVIATFGVMLAIMGYAFKETFWPARYSGQKWEYIIAVEHDDELLKNLNKVGEQGWEMISARRAAKDTNAQEMVYEMIFKRPKP